MVRALVLAVPHRVLLGEQEFLPDDGRYHYEPDRLAEQREIACPSPLIVIPNMRF